MAVPSMSLSYQKPACDMNLQPVYMTQGYGAGQPGYNAGGLPPSQVAHEFASNFRYFQTPGTPFVTRDSLEHAANRPMTGNPYHDRMTMLAREIIRNPQLSSMLDGMTQGGQQDGLISECDAHETVAALQAQEMPVSNYRPAQRYLGGYDGGLQRHRLENGYGGNGAYHPPQAYNPPGVYPPPGAYNSSGQFASQGPVPPVFNGTYASSQQSYTSPQNDEVAHRFKNSGDSELAMELGNNFDYFKPNANGKISQASLREIAGRPLTGNPVDDRMTLLAKEIISRPTLNRKLDSDHSRDKPDSIIGRDTTERVSMQSDNKVPYGKMNDLELLCALKDKFKQFWGSDSYISLSDLKKAAAASPPTDRSELAAELLRRPGLMKELDIGTNNNGGRGYEDERIDMDNLNYVIKEKEASQAKQ
ncbi:hypothetical protein JWR97_22630 [Pseudomonas cedrina subsp. fulgida]|nr:hypothetical protein [Pseudomonas cedrina subsp. fulgida]